MFYKNYSYTAKTFYGVTFQPGETKKVDGIINDRWVVPVDDSATKATKITQQKPSPEQPKEVPAPAEPEAAKPAEPELPKEAEPAKAEDKQKGKKS